LLRTTRYELRDEGFVRPVHRRASACGAFLYSDIESVERGAPI
jgi:hypothetical protein